MFASVKYILCSIVLSAILSLSAAQAGTKTSIGIATENIIDAAYNPFSSKEDTESGVKASCVSAVIYGLRAIGFPCRYRDFKVYSSELEKQANLLKIGKTDFDAVGVILFSKAHFASLYEDVNDNGLIDEDDKIIHAYFHPVKITTLAEWLNNDPYRPIYFVSL